MAAIRGCATNSMYCVSATTPTDTVCANKWPKDSDERSHRGGRPKIVSSPGGTGPHIIHGSLGPPESTSQKVSRLVRPFLELVVMSSRCTDHGTSETTARIFAPCAHSHKQQLQRTTPKKQVGPNITRCKAKPVRSPPTYPPSPPVMLVGQLIGLPASIESGYVFCLLPTQQLPFLLYAGGAALANVMRNAR